MKKTTKIIGAVAVAVVIIASIVTVGLFQGSDSNVTNTTAPTHSTTLYYQTTAPETFFDWDAYMNSLDLSETDVSTTVDPSDTTGVSGTVPNTSIVYVYPSDYTQPQITAPIITAPNNTTTTTEVPRVEMVEYKYMVNPADQTTVILEKYIGSDKTPRIPEEIAGRKVVEIGNSCFKGMKITSVYIPSTVSKINTAAFNGCQSLESVYFLGRNPVEIGDAVFENCTSLNKVSFSPATAAIGANAFSNCKALKTLTIPYTVTVIGANAFSGCADDFTIICEEGSEAYLTAIKYEIKYQLQ